MSKQIDKLVHIPVDHLELTGDLIVPGDSQGIVVFAHGSGSSRLSPRNKFVANVLNQSNLATLLVDLLSALEDQDYQQRFNIELLSSRLVAITDWLKTEGPAADLPIGYFGASTGAAAALQAAASKGNQIRAVVSRGGRPDLAPHIAQVTAPTLLIVGGNDYGVIELNQSAYEKLTCPKELTIVESATHLFEEPGTLEQVADTSTAWFKKYLKESG